MKIYAALVCFIFFCGGCSAQLANARAEGAHEVLNTVTDVVDPLYEASVLACDAAEGTVISRSGTTFEQDRAMIARIREVCDPIHASFETLRTAQLAARQTIDAWRSGDVDAAAVLRTVAAVQEAAAAARQIWTNRKAELTALLDELRVASGPDTPQPKLVLQPWGGA